MSPRKNRRVPAPPPPGGAAASQRVESASDGDWQVRRITGAAATKTYRCPGCDQEIPPGVAHVVTWPADARDADSRRHWHTPCWTNRHHRSPRIRRPGH